MMITTEMMCKKATETITSEYDMLSTSHPMTGVNNIAPKLPAEPEMPHTDAAFLLSKISTGKVNSEDCLNWVLKSANDMNAMAQNAESV